MTAKCRGCNQDLNYLRFLYNARHCPGLSLGNWTSFLNFNHVAFFGLVRFIMRMILIATHDDLPVQRMLDAALNQHGDRLIHFVGNNLADQRAAERLFFRAGLLLASF